MRLRIELFVENIDASVEFYTDLLGFEVARSDAGYTVLRRGHVVLGLGPMANLSEHDNSGPGPAWRMPNQSRGSGVELVLEVDDPEEVSVLHEHCNSRRPDVEPLRLRPWGLYDFRLTDPDGYYWRVTHGNAETSDTGSS
jgi:lactoylglutathione lyase